MKPAKKKPLSCLVWTWKIRTDRGWELCWFCFHTRALLLYDGKPTPDAVAVRVRMVEVRGRSVQR